MDIRAYLLGVTAAALMCSLIHKIPMEGSLQGAMKWLSAMVMTLAVVSPWIGVRVDQWQSLGAGISSDAQAIRDDALEEAKDSMGEIISERMTSYVLEKAQSLNADLEVTIELSEDSVPSPVGITLQGDISPYAKTILSNYLADTLGLTPEVQQWIK